MPAHEKINYVEYPARDLEATKRFFEFAVWSEATDATVSDGSPQR